jgi:hypothetical protein
MKINMQQAGVDMDTNWIMYLMLFFPIPIWIFLFILFTLKLA